MVLTEPDAGSDVGAGRTRAIPQPDGSWHIEGVKRFITCGEHDLTDNIIHYVLARPVGVEGVGGPGTKGLSLFVVPKFHFDPETGELGERNGVYATNVEHKMGLKVSNTCELTFGEHGMPAKGWLLGDVHDGIRQMFLIIEYARMMVGTKAIATLSTGYLNALEYAKNRVQGADLIAAGRQDRPAGHHHPPPGRAPLAAAAEVVRRGPARAGLLHRHLAGQGRRSPRRPATRRRPSRPSGSTTCCCRWSRACGSERAYELLGHESLQTFGGSGFLQDYPLEQYVRDAKIDTLYEGTTAIQSLDLIFRKIVRDNGKALLTVAGEIQEFLDRRGRQRPAQGGAAGARQGARPRCRASSASLTGWLGEAQGGDARALYKVGLSTPAVPARARRPGRRLAAAAPGRGGADGAGRRGLRQPTRPSTRARSPRPGSSPARCCPASAPTAGSSRAPTSTSWTSRRRPSECQAREGPGRTTRNLHRRPVGHSAAAGRRRASARWRHVLAEPGRVCRLAWRVTVA